MSLLYGGIPLLLPTKEEATWIEKNIDPRDACPWTYRAYPGPGLESLARPTGFRHPPPIRVGELRWPVGASRWAYAHFLASASIVRQLRDACYNGGGEDGQQAGNAPQPLVLGTGQQQPNGSGAGNLSISEMYLLPPTPLSGWRGVNGLYLLTLVDKRYYWWQQSIPTDFSIDCSSKSSWSNIITKLAGYVGEKITISAISKDYAGPHKSLALVGEVVPPVLDAACFNVGCKLVVDFSGNVSCQSYDDALAVHKSNVQTYASHIRAGGPRNADT